MRLLVKGAVGLVAQALTGRAMLFISWFKEEGRKPSTFVLVKNVINVST